MDGRFFRSFEVFFTLLLTLELFTDCGDWFVDRVLLLLVCFVRLEGFSLEGGRVKNVEDFFCFGCYIVIKRF